MQRKMPGLRFLRTELPRILPAPGHALSSRTFARASLASTHSSRLAASRACDGNLCAETQLTCRDAELFSRNAAEGLL
jgi:hypothetical protein